MEVMAVPNVSEFFGPNRSVPMLCPTGRSSVCRRLTFGLASMEDRCAQQAASEHFVQQLLRKMADDFRHKWEFDVATGAPIEETNRFEYSLIDATVLPSVYRPETQSPESSNDSDVENSSPQTVQPHPNYFTDSPEKSLRKLSPTKNTTPQKRRQLSLTEILPRRRSSRRGINKKSAESIISATGRRSIAF